MNRFIFENLFGIEGFNIAWYGIIIAFGMILGVLLASYRAKKYGIKSDFIFDFIILALPFAVIFARAYYVIFKWDYYRTNLSEIIEINKGGLAIYGGVIGGFIAAVIFCYIKKIPFLKFIDLLIPSLVLGQCIGRWGNFVNQEAFGKLIVEPKLQFFPYGVYINALGEWHQATFFYESMWSLALFITLLILSSKPIKNGILLSMYFIGYGTGRFLIEGFRSDSLYIFANVRASQLLSMLLVSSGIGLLILLKKNIIKSQHV